VDNSAAKLIGIHDWFWQELLILVTLATLRDTGDPVM
jgi:hypothetical protein